MKKIDQKALRLEIGKLTLGNFGLHLVGILEVLWFASSVVTGSVVGMVMSGFFGLYFAYILGSRQQIKKALLDLVILDEDEK